MEVTKIYTPKEIIEIFSYTEEEQQSFKYIHKYMKLIKPKLLLIEIDREKLKRFALIGLFLAYRANNHQGDDFTTEINLDDKENLYIKRISAVKEYFDITFSNTNEYLKMIDFAIIDFILVAFHLRSLPGKFYRFVMK